MIPDDEHIRARDSLQRFLFEHAAIRGEIVHLDATWRAVLERRNYPPALRVILGESMAAAALMSATVKFAGRLVMQIQGPGPIKLLVVECTSNHTMRAMAKWTDEIPSGPLAAMVGDGRLAITLDPTEGRERYQGIVSFVGNSIADSLQNYFSHSEQLPTRLWLTADSSQAAGMLLQRLPSDKRLDPDAWVRAVHLGSTITRNELLTLSARRIIHRLYHEEDIRLFDSIPLGFRCYCSRDGVSDALRMLGSDEIESILEQEESITVNCEFCNQQYKFDCVDAKHILMADVIPVTSKSVH